MRLCLSCLQSCLISHIQISLWFTIVCSCSPLFFSPASLTVSPWSSCLSLQRLGSYFISTCWTCIFHPLSPSVCVPSIYSSPLLILWTRGDLSHHFHFVVLIQHKLNSLTVEKNQLLPTFSHILSEILTDNSNSLTTKGIWLCYSTASTMIITLRQLHKHKYRGRHQRKSMMMIRCLKGFWYTCGILFGGIRYCLKIYSGGEGKPKNASAVTLPRFVNI